MLPTPADAIALFARSRPHTLAATELLTGESWTFAELDTAVARLAHLLILRGCQTGDRVAVLARNSVRQVMLHFACARAGLIYVPLNWRLATAELAELVERAGPRVLLADELSAPLLPRGLDVELLVSFTTESDGVAPLVEVHRDPDRHSLILFTSGTSGTSKGVLLSERNLQQTASDLSMLTAINGSSRFLCEAPMFHVIGLVANIRPVLQQGGSILVSDGFQAQRTLDWLADEELAITHYMGVPQMIESFRKQPQFNPQALRRMTAIVTGGAPHAVEDITAWLEDGVTLVSGFGMSEAGTVFGMPPDAGLIRAKPGSVGLPTPALQVRLIDAGGNDCQPDEAGELWLRGDAVMQKYWQDEELTAAVFAEGGWLKTGDIARCDADGFFWIVDRKKDMFISGGENIYPAEIEALLIGYPGLKEAAVIGVPDRQWGETGCLVVVEEEGQTIDEERLLDHLRQRLASYKIPKKVVTAETLPRTSTGKLQKGQLKVWLSKS